MKTLQRVFRGYVYGAAVAIACDALLQLRESSGLLDFWKRLKHNAFTLVAVAFLWPILLLALTAMFCRRLLGKGSSFLADLDEALRWRERS